jgi:hypothetical protein
MKSRIAAIAVAISCMAGAPVAVAAASSGVHRAGDPVATPANSCTYGKIMGHRKCLMAGEYCSHYQPAMRQYRHYGFKCSERDRRGDWHLERT